MIQPNLEAAARQFFDDFVDAFRTFDGRKIAERYSSPYLAFHSHTSSQVFTSGAETAEYFGRIVSAYHAKGCRSCRYRDLEVSAMGQECALATVTWELLAGDQSVISSWRESYNLCTADGRFLVFASTDHSA